VGQRTPLYQKHVDAGAKIVDFAGWDMPLHYGSQIAEHKQVRTHAGVFDVSHMNIVDLDGRDAESFLRHVLCGDVAKLQLGSALYSLLLNEDGGVIDDLIVYRRELGWRVVGNCGTREKVLAWLRKQAAGRDVDLRERGDLAILAVHGPEAIATVATLLPAAHAQRMQALGAFGFTEADDTFIARTGYTGEHGVELIVPSDVAAALWDKLVAAGVHPVGLGARDTLRLEAGMNLYGNDMDETTSPLESGLGWTIAWEPQDRDFIGRAALVAQKASGDTRKFVGLLLEDRAVLRSHQKVIVANVGEGEVTSGTFSPTLQRSIGFARVPAQTGDRVEVEIRGKLVPARVVRPPFVRHGQVAIAL
jgi:aminomethyltransferase